MGVLKTKSIVTNNGATFSQASVATFLGGVGVFIEPLMTYLVDNDEWFAKPDVAGPYTARNGNKYTLVASGAKFATMKVGGVTHALTLANNVIEAEATGIATVSLSNGKFAFGVTSGSATNGQRLAADGAGGFNFVDDLAYTSTNGQAVSTSIVDGVITSDLIIKSTADNVLAKDASGAYVLVKGEAGNVVSTSYNAATGAVSATFNVSSDAGNTIEARANGAYVQGITVASGSAQYAEIVNGQLSLKPLAIKDVEVIATGDMAAWVGAGYTTGSYQEGDMVLFPASSTAYVHNGGSAGTIADFTQIQVPNLTQATVRSWLSAQNGVTYNPTTGVFEGVVAAGNSGLTVGATGFNFAYQNQTVYDESGIMDAGIFAPTTLHNLLKETGTYAKKMWDTTCTYFYMSGVLADNTPVTKKFYLDGDGHLVYDVFTGGSDFATNVLTNPFQFSL
jgi:hypothetical protein